MDETLAFSSVTYPNSGLVGVKIYEDLPGSEPFALVDWYGSQIPNNTKNIHGRFTAVFDATGAQKLVSWSTTGTANDADFVDYETLITAAQSDTWAISGRTGGSMQDLIVRNIAITAGDIDSDADGLLDAWEITQGLDPDSNADGATVDSDGDTLTNGEEFDAGSPPLFADQDGDGANDAEELAAGTDLWDADSDDDGLTDGEEINGAVASDPLDPDSDDDGLGDYAEVVTHGTDPYLADSDGDGYSDPQELAAGSVPTDINSLPTRYFQTFDSCGWHQEPDRWIQCGRNRRHLGATRELPAAPG